MTIDNNIVLNGIQNNETHGLPLDMVSNKQYNIYLDYYSTGGFTITNNTAAHCQGGAGIILHGSQNVVIKNNTVYDCAIGVRFQELDGLGSPTRNVTMDNNVVFAKTLSQLCVLARSTTNDFNQYGTFANNHYAKPIDNTNAFVTLLNTWANTYHNLSGWKSYTSLDASSKMASQTITNVNDLLFEYNSTASPKTVSLNQPMTDARGTKYSTSITLQPFSSAVLMKDLNPVLADLTKPVITVFTIPANSSSLVVPINNFTVVSNQPVTGYKLTESATVPIAGDAGWTATSPVSHTFTSLGTKTLYAWVKDAAGNVSAGISAQVDIQKALGYNEVYASSTTNSPRMAMPVTVSETGQINSISIYHNGGTDNLILGVYSDQSGIPGSRLAITASTAVNPKAGWQTVPLTSPVTVNSGQKVWLAWVFQKNPGIRYTIGTPGRAASTSYWPPELPSTFGTSTIANNKFSVYCNYLPSNDLSDITKPVVNTFTLPSTSLSLTVSVSSFTASDNKGITGYLLTETSTAPLAGNTGWSASAPSSYTFASEGTKTLYAWAKDACR
jgi:parallel beta-helix repeat protein